MNHQNFFPRKFASEQKQVSPLPPGLEPEIQKLISKHKQELKKLRTLHEAELLQADDRVAQRYVRQCEELRQQLEREKEEQCQRERELAKQRYTCHITTALHCTPTRNTCNTLKVNRKQLQGFTKQAACTELNALKPERDGLHDSS